MSFQEMTLEALWANEPDHDWMVGDCPDKKCSEWYKLHTQWLNEVNHRFRVLEDRVAKAQSDISNLRDYLYTELPTGEVDAFDLIKLIKGTIETLDKMGEAEVKTLKEQSKMDNDIIKQLESYNNIALKKAIDSETEVKALKVENESLNDNLTIRGNENTVLRVEVKRLQDRLAKAQDQIKAGLSVTDKFCEPCKEDAKKYYQQTPCIEIECWFYDVRKSLGGE